MIKKLILITSILTFAFAVFAQIASAQTNIQNNELVSLAKDQTINEDYFATGEKVVISGIVNGDAYVAGGNIIVDGTVNGDLIAAGGTLNIIGNINGDTRLAGGQIIFSGKASKNLTTLGGSTEITNSASINGSLVSAGGNISVFAPVARGATFAGGAVTIANQINGNVNAGVGDITLTPNAKIAGNLAYWSSKEAQIQNGANVSGTTTHNITKKDTPKPKQTTAVFAGANLALKTISYLAALLAGFLLLKFAPTYTQKMAITATKKPLLSFGIGLLAMIIFPICFVAALATIIGIPIALISMALFLIELYFAKIIVSFGIGTKLAPKSGIYLKLAFGLLIYAIVTLIPVIGWLIALIVMTWGLGTIIISKKDFYLQLKSKKLT